MVKISVTVSGEEVGRAKLEYFTKSFKFYHVDSVGVDPEHQGNGHGRRLVNQIIAFLVGEDAVGFLEQGIIASSPAYEMYVKRGWQEIEDEPGILIYGREEWHTDELVQEALDTY